MAHFSLRFFSHHPVGYCMYMRLNIFPLPYFWNTLPDSVDFSYKNAKIECVDFAQYLLLKLPINHLLASYVYVAIVKAL